MVESHVAAFCEPLARLAASRGLDLSAPVQDESAALQRLRAAQQTGVLGLARCGLAHVPEAVASLGGAVRVMDASRNQVRWGQASRGKGRSRTAGEARKRSAA